MTKTRYTTLSLDELHFDPLNPRLSEHVRRLDEAGVREHLLLEEGLIELMASISEQGFFEGEPLLVTPRLTDSLAPNGSPLHDGFIVVEGNRRLAALQLLASNDVPRVKPKQVAFCRESAKHRPSQNIPALVFETRDEILEYLGYRHITGIKEWSALQKARYLKLLAERRKELSGIELYRTLAKEIGSRSDYVARILTGLTLLENARDTGLLAKLKLDEEDIPFSVLTTAIGYEDICGFIGLQSAADVQAPNLNEGSFSEFFRWCFDRSAGGSVLGESRNLEKLARIVSNDRALAVLRQQPNIDTADLYTSGPLETVRKFLVEAESAISNIQKTLPLLDAIDPEDVEQANRIAKAARAMHAAFSSFHTSDDDHA